MFSSATFLSLLLLTVSTAEARMNAPPIQRDQGANSVLAVASRVAALGTKNLIQLDLQRAAGLVHNAAGKRSGNAAVSNSGVVFDANVTIGIPGAKYTLLVDTGSSNTWVGSRKSHPYKLTGGAKKTGQNVTAAYGTGQFSGYEVTDTFSLGAGIVTASQSIGIATNATGFDDVDGILGIGPSDLTKGTLDNAQEVLPTVLDSLKKGGSIPDEVLGIYYAPSVGMPQGELSFGVVDTSKTNGAVSYVPITKTTPASTYWGIDQSITYGSKTILPTGSGIIDTGTTLILVSDAAFGAYQNATGGKMDQATGLLKITPAQFSALQPLNFQIGSQTYPLIPDAQIWPRSLNSAIGGSKDGIYLVLQSLGASHGGMDFINGFSFLQRFYSVFDNTKHQVGFATTASTNVTTNY